MSGKKEEQEEIYKRESKVSEMQALALIEATKRANEPTNKSVYESQNQKRTTELKREKLRAEEEEALCVANKRATQPKTTPNAQTPPIL